MTTTASDDLLSAEVRGRNAFHGGRSVTLCPHPPRSREGRAWLRGWFDEAERRFLWIRRAQVNALRDRGDF